MPLSTGTLSNVGEMVRSGKHETAHQLMLTLELEGLRNSAPRFYAVYVDCFPGARAVSSRLLPDSFDGHRMLPRQVAKV